MHIYISNIALNQVETVMRVGSMTLVTLLTSEAATLARQRSVGVVIAGAVLQVCIFFSIE